MKAFLGIDVGTTSLKAGLYDQYGNLLGLNHHEYKLVTPAPGRVELNANVYWEACCQAVQGVIAESGVNPGEIASLCISSQGETLIPVDASGTPTRSAIVWMDTRGVAEADLIGQAFDIDQVYHRTGQPEISPGWPACKLMWLRRHEPDVFERSSRFLLLEDYLLHRLTGQFVSEYSIQTSSMMVDIQQRRWWGEMLDFIGVPEDRLPHLMEPGAVVGPLSAQGAASLGLSTSTVAVTGSMDQIVGAVGAGNITSDVVTETTGGALAIVITTGHPVFDPQRRVPVNYHGRPDTYCLLQWAQTAGMALRWFRDKFYHLENVVAQEIGLDGYDLMTGAAAQVPAGSEGLIVLPHLEGAHCPEFNPAARAVFFGATLAHDKGHFVRAILEAVAYMLKRNLAIVEDLGIDVAEIRSMGGGARSPLWLQIKADVLQKPIRVVEASETACLGAAIMGATATGHFSNLDEGVAAMVRLGRTIEPSQTDLAAYEQGYARYIELYDRVAPLFV